jgi:hypothetical protein
MCIRISASASWSAFRRLSNPLSFAARTRNRKATFYPCPSWPNTPDEELPRVGDRTDAHRDCVRRHLRLCRCRGDDGGNALFRPLAAVGEKRIGSDIEVYTVGILLGVCN